jgi:hypothetical protein
MPKGNHLKREVVLLAVMAASPLLISHHRGWQGFTSNYHPQTASSGRFGIPNSESVRRTLAANSIIRQDFVRGSEHFCA